MIEYRMATVNDAYDIAYVNAYSWKSTYANLLPEYLLSDRIESIVERTDRIKKVIEKFNNCIVATDGEIVVGYVTFGNSKNKKYQFSGEIGELYVLDEYHKLGIGKTLFFLAVEKLVEKGHVSMIINCLKGNETLDFYKKLGGRVIDEHEDLISHFTLMEDVVYYNDIDKLINVNKIK